MKEIIKEYDKNDNNYCGETQYRIDEESASASLDIKLKKFARGQGIATKALIFSIEEGVLC